MTTPSQQLSPWPTPVPAADPWSFYTAVGTVVLAVVTVALVIVGIFAYRAALRQLDVTRRLSRIERTTEALRESQELRQLFAFFDVGAYPEASRAACTELYKDLIQAWRSLSVRRAFLKSSRGESLDVKLLASLKESMRMELSDEMLFGAERSRTDDKNLGKALEAKILSVVAFCERIWVLTNHDVIDPEIFLEFQDYNIAGTYYFLEAALADLAEWDGYDFSDFRQLAILASKHYRKRANYERAIGDAVF